MQIVYVCKTTKSGVRFRKATGETVLYSSLSDQPDVTSTMVSMPTAGCLYLYYNNVIVFPGANCP